jgi:kumamolisin
VHSYLKRVSRRPHGVIATYWTIPSLCAAYGWPTGLTGTGPIGIVELGGGYYPTDVTAAFTAMNLPAPAIACISTDGKTMNQPGVSDADGEVALDIQVAAAAFSVATGRPANLHLYFGSDIGTCVAAASANGCTVVSISWGADEAEWGSDIYQMDAIAQSAVAAGTLVFAASGDNDSSDGGPGAANVDAPASCPHVIGCGGTTFHGVGQETVWNNDPGQTTGEGTGGGFSRAFPTQRFQLRAPRAPRPLGRMVPDVCANADPQTGYEIVLTQGGVQNTQIYGGTSAVAPLYAGLFAAMDLSHAEVQTVLASLYQNPAAFNDITQGNNGAYAAALGPDACSGLGSPRAAALAKLFTRT